MSILLGKHHVRLIIKNLENITKSWSSRLLRKDGQKILSELVTNTKVEIAGAVTRFGSKYIGLDIGQIIGHSSILGIKITHSISDVFESSDIVIDFTTKECMLDCLKAAVKFKTPLISGTTGIEDINLKEYAAEIPILWSANMSVGINVLLKLVKRLLSFWEINMTLRFGKCIIA
ncbi:unnamed protein product [Ceratitis capitata]|uniref:(Mediterranean fruit fly) hypothetical protein n=1 Tax=Ceratitis capitata TaxID=7213 RepID=A0A811V518_CERCA|nr:unnamed protein product [Ceratitis capitata]